MVTVWHLAVKRRQNQCQKVLILGTKIGVKGGIFKNFNRFVQKSIEESLRKF